MLVIKTISIIDHYHKKNPGLVYFIENPRAMLRKMPFMIDLLKRTGGVRHTVTYCHYGAKYMKPTDIFTNSPNWVPKQICKAGKSCHENSPRSDKKSGLQGINSHAERSMIPRELCESIVNSMLQYKTAPDTQQFALTQNSWYEHQPI